MEFIMYQPASVLRPTSVNKQISSLSQPWLVHPVSTSLVFPGNGNGDNQHDENELPHGIIYLTDVSSDEVNIWSQIDTILS
jgi:hypothetical protein